MSYSVPPSIVRATPPTSSDDITKGFRVGSALVVEGSPRTLYVCIKEEAGLAVWIAPGGISSHDLLSVLGWSASGHTGTANSVAAFSATGEAQNIQPTLEGSVLTYVGGILTFATMAATVATLSAKTIDTYSMSANTDLIDPTTIISLESGSLP